MGSLSFEFDRGPEGRAARFARPSSVIRAETLDEIGPAFEAIARARAAGKWLAGLLSYELGYAFSAKLAPLMPENRDVPLMLFGVYDAPEAPLPDPVPAPRVPQFSPAVTQADYLRAFARVQDYIAAGDVYQINLTFPLRADCDADPRALYARLKAAQPVGHGVLVETEDFAVLSRSPELFFAIDAAGRATVRPMKGTVARGATPAADAQAVDWLRGSEKNRAENLMIVDLLRNDLSRIAGIGSVKVPALYDIETYATVHQMTSTVTAQLRQGVDFEAICRALFPCGSITGAPKIRAMQIIRELEPDQRGVYCGSIGWLAPTGGMAFNVAIRSLTLRQGVAVLNVGGGVVHDSEGVSEWAEALSKAAFVTAPPPMCG
ncbi:aminodeoxychorismate synthase component I [Rhodobacter capsulatus]|uniref:Para-aminobenzoate synthetase component 1 n=1 Tax=Rhodobacter capsulatus TaxID=1061 RepID=A0A1G7M8Q4_RHOCA|nr:aminodeoxychorismate synthase component I [Rhodobacter capsulatus]WER08505.1 aminodeoxychorismate synthase component I [Rhodobacter capsulatus]SDF57986.1 para-aminobenzoate synthetase component 1 [Rhodobacter capsulatus]